MGGPGPPLIPAAERTDASLMLGLSRRCNGSGAPLLVALMAGIRCLSVIRAWIQNESGQDFLEYVLILAAVAVAIAAILITGFGLLLPEILGHLCSGVDPLGSGGAGDCLTTVG
jgi:Flp pilus assembly pilin Flp